MIKTFFTLGVIQIVIMSVQLIKTKSLALLLGPDLVGVMAVVDKLIAVATQTFSLSLPFAASVYLPTLWVRDRDGFLVLLGKMRRVLVSSAVVAGAGGALLTLMRPDLWGEELVPYHWVVILAFLGIPALALAPFVQNVLAGRLQERSALGFTLLNAGVVTVTAVVGVLGWGLAGYYGLFAPAGLALVGVALYRIRQSSSSAPAPRPPPTGRNEEEVRDLSDGRWLPRLVWRFSLLFLGLTFLMPFAALFLHYSILAGIGTTAAGVMAAAIGISLAVKGVLGAANAVFLTPNVNRGGPPTRTLAWANAYGRTLILLAALLVPPLLLWPEIPVRILYSSAFLPGADYVAIFVLVEVIGLMVAVYSALPIAFDALGFHVTYSATGQLLMVLAATWLIPAYGILGAGLAMLIPHAIAFTAVGAYLRYRHDLPVPGENLVLLVLMIAALSGAGILGVRLHGWSTGTIAIKAAAYLGMLLVFLTRLTPEERKRLRRLPRELLAELSPSA